VAELPKDPSPLGSVPHGTREVGGFDMARNTSGRRLGGLLAILVLGLLLLGAAGGTAVGEDKLGPRRYMLALTNSDRERYERRELAFADHLATYAKAHSQAMANDGYIYHSTGDQLRRALDGYDWELGGENVGVGGSLESLEDAFMASDLHRQNILRRVYEHAAVGIARADDRIWITVIFYG
jgi:Cysteine-rich secretory protein family